VDEMLPEVAASTLREAPGAGCVVSLWSVQESKMIARMRIAKEMR